MVDAIYPKDKIIRLGLKAFFVWIVLSLVILLAGDSIANALIPVYRWTLSLNSDYHIQSLTLQEMRGEKTLQLTVNTSGKQVIVDQLIAAGYPMTASTLAAHIYQPVIVSLIILLVWPLDFLRRVMCIATMVLLLPLFLQLDVPMVLLGSMDDLLWYQLKPDAVNPAWRIFWMNVMNGGGRLLLGIVAGLCWAWMWQSGKCRAHAIA